MPKLMLKTKRKIFITIKEQLGNVGKKVSFPYIYFHKPTLMKFHIIF